MTSGAISSIARRTSSDRLMSSGTTRDPATAANFVTLARLATLRAQPVAANHVPHVREIPDRIEISHVDDRFRQPLLDADDLAGGGGVGGETAPGRPAGGEPPRA